MRIQAWKMGVQKAKTSKIDLDWFGLHTLGGLYKCNRGDSGSNTIDPAFFKPEWERWFFEQAMMEKYDIPRSSFGFCLLGSPRAGAPCGLVMPCWLRCFRIAFCNPLLIVNITMFTRDDVTLIHTMCSSVRSLRILNFVTWEEVATVPWIKCDKRHFLAWKAWTWRWCRACSSTRLLDICGWLASGSWAQITASFQTNQRSNVQ